MLLAVVGPGAALGDFSIASFFKSISDWFVMIMEYIRGFFGDIVYLVKITGTFLGHIPEYFSWFPSEGVTLIVLTFSIVVLYKVFGREG